MNKRKDLDLDFKWDSTRQRLLQARGVDGYAFSLARSPFVVEDAITRIAPKNADWLPEEAVLKPHSVTRQIRSLDRLMNNPLNGNYIACIGGHPSDVRAKVIAANVMSRAIDLQMEGHRRGKAYPLWHRVYGGFADKLRDGQELDPCSMLILTNVGMDSSQTKLEKLRDILEMYDSIPKIVVVNGCDPITFFASKVRMPLRHAIYVDAAAKPTAMGIMDI